jgi:hypothetical protein
MLWKQLKPSYRRLMRRGLQGEALIVRATADRQKGRIGSIFGWNVTIRVKFDDNSSADFKRYVDASVLSFDGDGPESDLAAGMVVPIRFDPVKRSRVEIDTAALRSQAGWAPVATVSAGRREPGRRRPRSRAKPQADHLAGTAAVGLSAAGRGRAAPRPDG